MRGFWLEAGEAGYAFLEFAPRRSQDIQPMYHDSEQDWRLAELKYQFMKEKMGNTENACHVWQEKREWQAVGNNLKAAARHCFLREAKREDMEQIFLWANEKEVRKNSFSMSPISYEEHRDWYDKKLKEESTQMYLLCDGSLEVGFLRLEFDAEGAEISYSIAPEYRGCGYGKKLISLAEQEVREWAEKQEDRNAMLGESIPKGSLPRKAVIKARVKPGNHASKRIFTCAGYEKHAIGYQKILW